jgi:hypothetical protein
LTASCCLNVKKSWRCALRAGIAHLPRIRAGQVVTRLTAPKYRGSTLLYLVRLGGLQGLRGIRAVDGRGRGTV